MRWITLIAVLPALAGCASSDDDRPHRGEGQAPATTERIGQKTKRATDDVGAKLHHIFRDEVPAAE